MFVLRSSEGEFSAGTRVEIVGVDDYRAIVKTVGKIQRYKTTTIKRENGKFKHTKVEDGQAQRIVFHTDEDNLVELRDRTR